MIRFELKSVKAQGDGYDLTAVVRVRFLGVEGKKAVISVPLLGRHRVDPVPFHQISFPSEVEIVVIMKRVSALTPIGELLYRCQVLEASQIR